MIKIKSFACMLVIAFIMCGAGCVSKKADAAAHQLSVKIILGSTRQGRMSPKIAHALKQIADKRTDIKTEIIDLNDYNLPFFNEATPPASRKTITDPIIQRWSDVIQEADAFIIVSPEYNSGYPGVLKNALDWLYKEWNNKPVGFVGYAGGSAGATTSLAQLHQVAHGLEMKTIATDINIPSSWKALDETGDFVNKDIGNLFNTMLDQLIRVHSTSVK